MFLSYQDKINAGSSLEPLDEVPFSTCTHILIDRNWYLLISLNGILIPNKLDYFSGLERNSVRR